MAEWLNAAALKAAVPINRDRGFKSHSLRHLSLVFCMIKFNHVNYFKFVLSLSFIVSFILVIANADLFESDQEQLAINSSFIQGDDGVSYKINLGNINIDVDTNNNGIIGYTVQS